MISSKISDRSGWKMIYAAYLNRFRLFLICLTVFLQLFKTLLQLCTGIASTTRSGVDVSRLQRCKNRNAFEPKGRHSFTKWWQKVRSARRKGEGSKAPAMRKEVDGWRGNEWNFLQRREWLVSHSKTSQQPMKCRCKCAVQWTMTDLRWPDFHNTHHIHVQEHTRLTLFFFFFSDFQSMLPTLLMF